MYVCRRAAASAEIPSAFSTPDRTSAPSLPAFSALAPPPPPLLLLLLLLLAPGRDPNFCAATAAAHFCLCPAY
jgi:hypothetical protein